MNLEKKIKDSLEEVRPMLQADGGDVEFVSFDDKTGKLYVRMLGMCAGCPMAQMTIQEGIEKTITTAIPEVKSVESA